MPKLWPPLALLLAHGCVAAAGGNCYTIYDHSNRAVYQSTEPPIDMSQPISTGMAKRYPGHFLVVATDNRYCQEIADESRFAGRAVASLGDGGAVTGTKTLRDPTESKLFRDAQPLRSSSDGSSIRGKGR
jgi:hypothetical protein